MEVTMRSHSGDVFEKVRGMIQDMIAMIQEEAEKEAQQKAFCDREMAETKENREDKMEEVQKLSTKIDTLSAEVTKLNGEVAEINKELASLASWQSKMDKTRE